MRARITLLLLAVLFANDGAIAQSGDQDPSGDMITTALNTLEAHRYHHFTHVSLIGGLVYATVTKDGGSEQMMVVVDPKMKQIVREGETAK